MRDCCEILKTHGRKLQLHPNQRGIKENEIKEAFIAKISKYADFKLGLFQHVESYY